MKDYCSEDRLIEWELAHPFRNKTQQDILQEAWLQHSAYEHESDKSISEAIVDDAVDSLNRTVKSSRLALRALRVVTNK